MMGSLVTACGGYVRVPFDISAPTALPPDLPGEVGADGRTSLHLDDLELRIEARNQRATGAAVAIVPLMWILPVPMIFPAGETTSLSSHYPVLLFLELDPAEPGFFFEPMAVRLTPVAGDPVPPKAFVGPGQTSGERCLDAKSQKDDLTKSVEGKSFPIEPSQEPTCFAIVFGSVFPPSVDFQLYLGKLSRHGVPVDLPALQFSKRRARSMGEPRTWRPASLTP